MEKFTMLYFFYVEIHYIKISKIVPTKNYGLITMSNIKFLFVKNHWSIDQWHLEVYEPRYYSGSYTPQTISQ